MRKPAGNWSLGKSNRWEINVKIHFREVDCGDVKWTELVQNH
jgi:hypothetical protein